MSDQPFAPSSDNPTDNLHPADNQTAPIEVSDLEILTEEIAAFIERRLAELPDPEPADVPSINVAPSTATIEVNVPQQLAPIVNVETVAPQITVEAAPATVNVLPSSPQVLIENHPPLVTVPPPAVEVSIDMTPIARAIADQTLATQSHLDASEAKMDDLIKATNANASATNAMASAIGALVKVMAAPKSLVMKDGKPVGIKVA